MRRRTVGILGVAVGLSVGGLASPAGAGAFAGHLTPAEAANKQAAVADAADLFTRLRMPPGASFFSTEPPEQIRS